jgi:hypothetical protein
MGGVVRESSLYVIWVGTLLSRLVQVYFKVHHHTDAAVSLVPHNRKIVSDGLPVSIAQVHGNFVVVYIVASFAEPSTTSDLYAIVMLGSARIYHRKEACCAFRLKTRRFFFHICRRELDRDKRNCASRNQHRKWTATPPERFWDDPGTFSPSKISAGSAGANRPLRSFHPTLFPSHIFFFHE